ncbi:MAG: thiamine pyrophosphate-binding protein [Candidatus Sumerlaeota bacterium]|nr:thiamine pyrophosphate-binding protein [Candidatus Sumerlaeota bacterium]
MSAHTVGHCVIQRLIHAGLKHVFGIPGDYVLGFYDMLQGSPITLVGTATEAGAAFAADAYARVNGLGAICVTYAVGGLNTVNAVAGAYAEKSPVIVISGAPGLGERIRTPYLHRRVRDFNTQREIFEKVTVASVVLDDPRTAPALVDQVIAACLKIKRPVYIELPRDVVGQRCLIPPPVAPPVEHSDPQALREALDEAVGMLRRARRPAILAGVEIHRFGLQQKLIRLVERSGYPIAASILGKSVISELHPNYLGIYEGAMGKDSVRLAIERADCLLFLGEFMTDINLGIYTAKLDVNRMIYATSERTAIKHHVYEGILLRDFIDGLAARLNGRRRVGPPREPAAPFRPRPRRAMTIRRFFERMNDFLEDDMIVVCDIGDSLFGAADLTIHRKTEFLGPAYYASMGFGVPAALGAQIGARRLRPIVFVGDGAFQMTGQELSSIVRQGLNPIVFVLNNQGYTTERIIREGPYNDILNWQYHRMPEVLGDGWGAEVRTEGELEEALAHARRNTKSFSIINVRLDKYDCSEALKRLGRRLKQKAEGKR